MNKPDEKFDNGGAIAIKGFNYQHAIASLIIILNYKKENFCIYLETKDDIEVSLEDKHIFIQVKGQKLSLQKLIKPSKKDTKPILLKNLLNNSPKNNRYKIVMIDLSVKDKKSLTNTSKIVLFDELKCYSEEQKKVITNELSKYGIDSETIQKKLLDSYIYFSPFINNAEQANTYLLGCMNQKEIRVDSNRGTILLNELLKLISQKSEKIIENDKDKELKKLDYKCLKKLFKSSELQEYRDKLADHLHRERILNLKEHMELKKELCSKDITEKALIKEISELIDNIDTNKDEITVIQELYSIVSKIKPGIKKTLLYAILIDLYLDKIISELEDKPNEN